MKITQELLNQAFHAYDVRATIGDILTKDFFYHLGKAFVTHLKATNIIVGQDFRETSTEFRKAFVKGATECGSNVIYIGEIPTELMYFAVGSTSNIDGGVTITASHNPSEYNGCKMVKRNAEPIYKYDGMEDIKEIMFNQNYLEPEQKGMLSEQDFFEEYKKKVLSFIGDSPIKPFKILVDAGNGIGGKVFNQLFGELGLETTEMYFEPDSTFPHHVPNPLKIENNADIIAKLQNEDYDFGIAIDGDADRVVFFDKNGNIANGLFTGTLFVEYFLQDNPGETVLHDPRVYQAIKDAIYQFKGYPRMTVSGHAFFKKAMKESRAIFGAELSSHFFYRDFYNADSGMISIAIFLKLMSDGLKFSERLQELKQKYPLSGEVNYKVDDIDKTIEKIEEYFELEPIKIDGLNYVLDGWNFNVRKSNTEPVLRLNVEGKNKADVINGFNMVEGLIDGERLNKAEMEELN